MITSTAKESTYLFIYGLNAAFKRSACTALRNLLRSSEVPETGTQLSYIELKLKKKNQKTIGVLHYEARPLEQVQLQCNL